MYLKELIKKIEGNALPGKQAHRQFSPQSYKRRGVMLSKTAGYKLGAVLILLYPSETGLNFVLTQRHEYDGAHSGQVSLPGGKVEADESNKEAALRETYEEIGVSRVTIVKALTELYIPPSNFFVSPFVGYVTHRPLFIKDAFEVKEVLEVPLNDLLMAPIGKFDLVNSSSKEVRLSGAPSFFLCKRNVWGATGMILNEFKHLLLK